MVRDPYARSMSSNYRGDTLEQMLQIERTGDVVYWPSMTSDIAPA